MTLKTSATAAAVLALAATLATPLAAQTRRASSAARPAAATAAPASGAQAPALQSGPPIAGVCIFNAEEAVATSSAGKSATARMQQLTAQVTAELQPEQTSLQNDEKTFQTQRSTLTADQVQSRGQALQARVNAFEQKAQQRQQELRATAGKAQQRIEAEMTPLVRAVYTARNCSMMLNGGAVLGANPQMDVTPAVISQLDAKMPSITFDREHLDQAAAAR